ncbi:MAG: PspC domain-containing protein, partial [Myxococcota bacterium]
MNRPPLLPARPPEGRIVAGVCAGIGDAFAFDITLVRLAFLVLALAWGLGVLLYGALWLAMPDPLSRPLDRRGARAAVRHTAMGMRSDLAQTARYLNRGWQRVGRDPWPRPLGRRWMAIGFVLIGLLVLLGSLGAFSWITPMRALSLALIAAGVA